LIEITGKVNALLETRRLGEGLCTVFVRHTSASLLIQENADPGVLIDLEHWLGRWVEDGDPAFRHRSEGPDDMAAHIRSALTQTSIGIPFSEGSLALGTWQGLYLWEHRYSAHERQVLVHLSTD
jgi:secondary thiamine-phosphate synthase enzyme